MAATQYSDFYNYNSSYQNIHHHHQSQPQNIYGYATGQFDCKNLNVNEAYNNYAYNSPNNYNDQWTQHYNAIPSSHQHHQTQPHYHHQHLNMLNHQINDDYKNYSHHGGYGNAKPISSDVQHHSSNRRNEHQPNLNCNQYVDAKNDLFYGQQPTASIGGEINEAIASSAYPCSQLTEPTKKRKLDNSTASADSPRLRGLLTRPAKRERSSPYFHQRGSISPASSTDNYSQHYQLPSTSTVTLEEQSVNLNHYSVALTKEGYESSIDETPSKSLTSLDGKFSAASRLAPSSEVANSPMSNYIEGIATPPSTPKDSSKIDESSDNLWNDQNGGLFNSRSEIETVVSIIIKLFFNYRVCKRVEAHQTNVHAISNTGIREGIQLQQILDPTKAH